MEVAGVQYYRKGESSKEKGFKMKNKLFIISGLGFISSLLLGSCASRQLGGFQDDLYQSTAKAVERPYLSPDYYYDSVGDARAEGSDYDGDYETYVDDED